jgi:hypothetical protein
VFVRPGANPRADEFVLHGAARYADPPRALSTGPAQRDALCFAMTPEERKPVGNVYTCEFRMVAVDPVSWKAL